MKPFFFLCLLAAALTAPAQHWNPTARWPGFNEVMDSVETHYDFKQGLYNLYRSPSGWGVQIRNQENELLSNIIVWTTARGWEFQPWNFSGLEDHCLHCDSKSYYEASFRLHPYWGYPGWDMDEIELLRGKTYLSDSAWFVLARAYAHYAQGLIRPQWEFHTPGPDSAARYQSIGSQRLLQYRAYQDSCIMAYRQVEALNPRFETIIGEIGVKIASEHVHTALTLESLKAPSAAALYYAEALYPTLLISSARNFLEACPEDAILFTYGDNDTYPLLYVQQKYSIRQDIRVINLSLLYTGWYSEMLRDNLVAGRNPVSMSTPAALWYDNVSSYIMIDENSAPGLISEILSTLKVGGEPGKVKMGNRLRIPRGNGQEFSWVLKGEYLMRNELVMLDIMASNPFRPLCFTATSDLSRMPYLAGNLRYEGMIYSLQPEVNGHGFPGMGLIQTEVLQNQLARHFDAAGYREAGSSETYQNLRGIAKMSFASLAWSYVYEGRKASADSLLDRYRIVFGEDPGRGSDMLLWAETWYRMGERERVDAMMRGLMESLAIEYQEAELSGNAELMAGVRRQLNIIDIGIEMAEQEEDMALVMYLRQKRQQMR